MGDAVTKAGWKTVLRNQFVDAAVAAALTLFTLSVLAALLAAVEWVMP